jgi:hypothetical protein
MNQLFEEFIAEFIHRELREVWQSRGWPFLAQSTTQEKPTSPEGVGLPAVLPVSLVYFSELVEESLSFPRRQKNPATLADCWTPKFYLLIRSTVATMAFDACSMSVGWLHFARTIATTS